LTIEARFRLTRGGFRLDADFSVPAHGVTGLYGPSGSGKTTLLRAIAGLDRIPGGSLMVGDTFWQRRSRFRPPHRRPVGYVFQEPSLFPHLDVRRNLAYGHRRIRAADRRVSLERAIELLEIGGLLDRTTDTLSGGERQRVAITRALAVSPELLLLDEPLAALDRDRRREVLPYLDTLHKALDIPVIYVSHAIEEMAQLADHLLLMAEGRIIGQGPIGEVLTRLDLPLAHDPDSAAVIETTVSRHDDAWHLTVLKFTGGRFLVPRSGLAVGERVRVRAESRDVSLALTEPAETSILNIIPAVVEELAEEGPSQVTVRLQAGQDPLLARITRKSATTLRLAPGKRVFAQVKSVALLR